VSDAALQKVTKARELVDSVVAERKGKPLLLLGGATCNTYHKLNMLAMLLVQGCFVEL